MSRARTDAGVPQTTTSADGTTIAFERHGDGPPIVLVGGAFSTRASTAPLAVALGAHLTAINPDRRGRGDSGDTPPYAVERELDDLDAVIAEAGGAAAVFGWSSGANLVLQAAARGSAITTLVVFDAPFAVDDDDRRLPAGLADELEQLVAAGRRGDAVELYQRVAVGMPEDVVVRLRQAPFRPALEAVAHTLAYDARVVGDLSLPAAALRSVAVPTLVLAGEHSPPLMRKAAAALVRTLPDARGETLAGQGHDLSPEVLAPVLLEALG